MILHRPGPVEREAEIKVWGDWVWCFWHRVGEKVIVCQWARRKYTRISNNKFRVEWRNPDKTLIESLIFDEPAGW